MTNKSVTRRGAKGLPISAARQPRMNDAPTISIIPNVECDEAELQDELSRLGLHDFETPETCRDRQLTMVKRLRKYGRHAGRLSDCVVTRCPEEHCREGCHFGARRRRLETITTAFEAMHEKVPVHRVTVVHPKWRQLPGDLHKMRVKAIQQWVHRALSRARAEAAGVTAIGIVEVSLNRELDGSEHWAGEAQLVVGGAPKEILRSAFGTAIPSHLRQRYDRPVMVNEVTSLGRSIGYAQKKFVEYRVAYIDPSTGRQGRNHLPLRETAQVEYDLWTLSQPLGALTIVSGLRRRGQKLFPLS